MKRNATETKRDDWSWHGLRAQPALIVLVLLLFAGVAMYITFTARGGPPRFGSWLMLTWLVALVGAIACNRPSKPSRRRAGRRRAGP